MSALQNLAEVVALDQIAKEYSETVQIAGLNRGIVDVCRADATCPNDLRRMLTRMLQGTLPANAPRSVRADGSHMPDAGFSAHERKVKDAILEQAHQSPMLRPVVSRDRSGREITEFFGAKNSWMSEFKKAPLLMSKIDGAPVRIPVIL